jgi:hypothetical protein
LHLLILFSGFYQQHVLNCANKQYESSEPVPEERVAARASSTPSRKAARQFPEEAAEQQSASCHICLKTYKNVTILKTHYVRAHFLDALCQRYLPQLAGSLTSGGDLPTCPFCPFRCPTPLINLH